jgi:hypothetical protein
MTNKQVKQWQTQLELLTVEREENWRAGKPEDKQLERKIRFTLGKLGLTR